MSNHAIGKEEEKERWKRLVWEKKLIYHRMTDHPGYNEAKQGELCFLNHFLNVLYRMNMQWSFFTIRNMSGK